MGSPPLPSGRSGDLCLPGADAPAAASLAKNDCSPGPTSVQRISDLQECDLVDANRGEGRFVLLRSATGWNGPIRGMLRLLESLVLMCWSLRETQGRTIVGERWQADPFDLFGKPRPFSNKKAA